MKAKAQMFLSYAREDEGKVRNLYQKLSDAGFKPWMDKKDILPGERWESSIWRAIKHSDFFLACLSANSANKRGWIQKEIKEALDIWQEMLDSDIYLIPVRLEDCEVPESLCDFQWVNLFEKDGWTQLMKAIQIGIERRKALASGELSPGTEIVTPREDPERILFGILWPQFVNVAYTVVILDPESREVIYSLKEKLSTAFDLINKESKPEEWESLVKAVSDFCQYISTQANKTSLKDLGQLVAELVGKIIANLSTVKHPVPIAKRLKVFVKQLEHL